MADTDDQNTENQGDSESRDETLAKQLLNEARNWGMESTTLAEIEKHAKSTDLTPKAIEILKKARDRAEEIDYGSKNQTRQKERVDKLVGEFGIRIPIRPGEVWANAVIAELESMTDSKRADWIHLWNLCGTATTSKPSAKFRKEAEARLDVIGRECFIGFFKEWLPLINQPKEQPSSSQRHPLALLEINQDFLRGLIWVYALTGDEELPKVLAATGISAYRKLPGIGERATRVGNACVMMIGNFEHPDSVSQLAILKMKVKTATARKLIEKQLDETAKRQGISRAELEEIGVPTYGMETVGLLEEPLGDFVAELSIVDQKTQLFWRKQDGTTQKSVPAAVKNEFSNELKEIKAAAKEMTKVLAAQKHRIESLYLEPRTWTVDQWRTRYLDHPLVGTLARRLLWKFHLQNNKTQAGVFLDGQIVDVDGNALEFDDTTHVELWHPLDEPAETVLAWRQWLEAHAVRQPFKQAHREIYVLTEAEMNTSNYSNRHAAHILNQAQYRTLAQSRAWVVNFLGAWDAGDEGLAARQLHQFDIRAEFWVGGTEIEPGDYGMTHVSTDQVRFYRPNDAQEPSALDQIPPIVFSEVMRDVDLFVGVASVGNDPNWQDGGPGGHYFDYWQGYSFGDLSATAKTRKAVLERVIPKLKIADRCTFEDRFLVVRGELRTYKIHLGSSNILMLPNDQYLCIVPGRSPAAVNNVALPFEGDHTLDVILSKAFLLAADDKIKDSTIVSQISQ